MKYHRTNFHYKMHSCLRNIYVGYSHISLLKPAISRSRRRVRANVCKSCTGAITYTPAGELSSIRSPSGLLVSLDDPRDQYNTATIKPISRRKGSWVGHQQQFNTLQVGLRKRIADADANGCNVDAQDRLLAYSASPPDRPAGR